MPKVMLGVIGNGRYHLLERTILSQMFNVKYPFSDKVMINDTGQEDYSEYLLDTYGVEFDIINHETNQGLSGSIKSLWEEAIERKVDYVFHLEEDYTFNQPIDIDMLIEILDQSGCVQVALKRQSVYDSEVAVGGFMQEHPEAYTPGKRNYEMGSAKPRTFCGRHPKWVEQGILFTLNPSLYPISTVEIGWPISGAEHDFQARLDEEKPGWKGAFYTRTGDINDEPIVTHIGEYRGDNWCY